MMDNEKEYGDKSTEKIGDKIWRWRKQLRI